MKRRYTAIVDGREVGFELEKTGEGSARFLSEGRELDLDVAEIGPGQYSIIHDGLSSSSRRNIFSDEINIEFL
jgi:hypothetical protein